MPSRLLLSVATALAAGSSSAANIPSHEQVQAWWGTASSEDMRIEGEVLEIHLRSQELAYIAEAAFYQRGRNDTHHTVLIRPKLQQVRELAFPVGGSVSVQDADGDGVSELITIASGSGQGTTVRIESIVQVDGWKPVLLHQVRTGDNLGMCGSVKCKATEVEWRFERLQGQNKAVLVETISTSTGRTPEHMTTTKVVVQYLLSGGHITRANPSIERASSSELRPLPAAAHVKR
jgi:hypothetical protein